MSGLLRRSTNLARNARAISECAACAQRQQRAISRPSFPSRTLGSGSRYYATVNPSDPKPPKNGKDGSKKKRDGLKGSNENDVKKIKEQGHVNINLNAPGAQSEPSQLAPGHVKPTEEQMKKLEEMVSWVREQSHSESQRETLDELVQYVKKNGMPSELPEIMKTFEDNSRVLDLATMKRIWGLTRKMYNTMADEQFKSEEQELKKGQDPDSKSEDSGKKDSKSKEGQKSGQQSAFGEIKLDWSTTLVVTFLTWYTYKSIFPGENTKDITWQEFRTTFFDKGLVEKLTVINHTRVRVDLRREAVQQMYPESPAGRPNFYYYFTIGSVEAFERRLDEAHRELGIPSSERIPVSYAEDIPWAAALFNLAPTLLLIGGIFWMSRRAAGGGGGANSGIFGIGKSRAKKFNHETDVKIKFSDVAGMDEAKVEIMEFVSFLKDPTRFQKLGAKIPRGAVLSGPPGTGKTLLAKATAGESGVPFFSVSGSEFVEMFVGVGASRVRDLFANARKSTPCIIFIDEIDAIGKSRSKQNYGGGNDEREATLNQILTEMDGFNTTDQVVVLAGTNRPDVLDRALLRPGRFDRHISIDRPTMDGRKAIFAVHLRKIVTSVDMEYLTGRLSALTPGFSGADIANCVNEAALIGKQDSPPFFSTVLTQHSCSCFRL